MPPSALTTYENSRPTLANTLLIMSNHKVYFYFVMSTSFLIIFTLKNG